MKDYKLQTSYMTRNDTTYTTKRTHAALRLLLLLLMMAGVTGAWATVGITGIPYSANFNSNIEPFDKGHISGNVHIGNVFGVKDETATAKFATNYVPQADETVTIEFTAYHGWLNTGGISSISVLNSEGVVLVGYSYNHNSVNIIDVTLGGTTATSFSEFSAQSTSTGSQGANGIDGNGRPYIDGSGTNNPKITMKIWGDGKVSFKIELSSRFAEAKTYETTLDGNVLIDLSSIVFTSTCTNSDRTLHIGDLDIATNKLYRYTVNAVDGGSNLLKTIETGTVSPGTTKTFYYPQYVVNGTTLYNIVQDIYGTGYWYRTPERTINVDKYVESITYNSGSPINNVVMYVECEDIPGVSRATVESRASKGAMGYCNNDVNVFTIQKGKYKLYWRGVNGNTTGNRNAIIKVGGNEVGSFTVSQNNTNTTGNFDFDVPATGMLSFKSEGSQLSGVDWFYIQAVYAYEAQRGTVTWHGTSTPVLVKPADSNYETITYSSSNTNIASVNGSGTITGVHNGTAVITATANGGAVATYTVTVVDEPLAKWADVVSGGVETITATDNDDDPNTTADGYLPWIIEGTNLNIGFSTEDAIRYIDSNYWCVVSDTEGRTEVTVSGTGVPLSGSFYKLTPKENGTITLNGAPAAGTNGIRLTDEWGQVLETVPATAYTQQNYVFQTVLMAGRTYYVFGETAAMNGGGNTTLVVHEFKFTKVDGLTISLVDQSLQLFPNSNANNNRLDRTIPGFKIEFGGGDDTKYQSNGTFIMHNGGGSVTITPLRKTGNEEDVTITDVRLTYSNPTDNPQVSVNGGASETLVGTAHSWTSLTGHTVTIAQTGGSSSSFLLETITIRYTLSNGAELSTDLGTVGITIAGDGIVYGPTGSAQDADVKYSQPNLFHGDMSFSYTGSGFANGNTVAPSKQDVDGDDLTHYKYYVKEGDIVVTNEPYRVRIGSGLGRLTATYDGSFYFAPATASVRLYSQEYVETCNMTLAAGQSYTIPSTPGYQLTLYAHSASGETILRLDGTDRSSVTPQDDPIVTYTSAGANRITLTNTSDHESIIIYQIEVSKPKVYANVVYPKALGSDHCVLFFNETYEIEERTPAIIDEGGNDITAYYDLGSKARTYNVNASGTTMNGSTFAITTGNEQGYVDVTYTYNVLPQYADTYPNVSTTMRLYVSKGEWDFYNYYKAGNHNELNGSPTWIGSGYNQLQDNMYYSYVVKSNGDPMSQAVGLQTKYKLRFSWVRGNAVGGRLHLFGKGVNATNKSAWDHGGCVRVPVKKGMLVEITSVAAEDDNVEMEIVGLNDTEGNPVSTLTANLGDLTPQRFIAAQDGYFDIINSSFNQNYWIYKIKVSDDIVFEYTDNPLYLDPTINSPFTNRVVNQGESTINFSYANTANTAVTAFNTSTGNTDFSGYGKWTVTATGTSGMLNGKTASYNAISLGFIFNEPDPVNVRPEEYYEFVPKDQIVIDPGNMNDLDLDAIKNQVVFSVVSVSPETSFANIDGDGKLTIYGVADVVVEARLGAIVRQITYRVQGARLNDHHPVILNTQDEYLVYLEGISANISDVSFNTIDMTKGIVGDLKTRNITPTYESTTYNGMTALRISGLGNGIGGVIPIIATYKYNNVDLTLKGTLTVAYSKKHWYFGRENLIDSLYNWEPKNSVWYEWNLGDPGTPPTYEKPDDAAEYRDDQKAWRMVRKISGHTNVSMVYYYNRSQEGQNAIIIPQTNGLHIHSTRAGRQLGVEMMVDHTGNIYPATVVDGHYDCRNLMLLRGGRLIIPKVRPGQWIEVRWTRHNPDMAERMTMENLLDVEGKYISGTYKIGNCHYEMDGTNSSYHNYLSSSTYMFQVASEADGITLDEDGCVDAVFAVQDNIYISFQEIILHEPGWEYKSSYQQKLNTTNSFSTTGDLSYQQLLNPGDIIRINGPAYQNAPNAPTKWEIELDETLTNAEKTQGDNPTITYNGGYGKAYVTLSSYSQDGSKYVANRNTWVITFGKKPAQTYPYTWDFTKYFSNTKAEVGSTENGHDNYFEEDEKYMALTTRHDALDGTISDRTFSITNPDFESNTTTGWTLSTQNGGSAQLLPTTKDAIEYWAGEVNDRTNRSFDYYQELTVPNGTYKVGADMFNSMNGESGTFSATCCLYAYSNGTEVYTMCNMDGITLNSYLTPEITVTNQKLKIGVKNTVTPMVARWFVADNFRLYYMNYSDLKALYSSSDYSKTAAHEYRKVLDTWTESSNTETVITTNYDTPKYGSYFVDGAQLVSRKLGVLPETEGLGFSISNKASGGLTLDMQSTVGTGGVQANSSGETWRSGELTITGGGTIIVPKPGSGFTNFYVYVRANSEPSVNGSILLKQTDDVSDAGAEKQYRYHFLQNADAVLTFSSNATVYSIGVTDMIKPLTTVGTGTKEGWATESRDRTIDYTLTGYLTTNSPQAYVVEDATHASNTPAQNHRTTVKMGDEQKRYVVPHTPTAPIGLVMRQTAGVTADYSVPLFVPAVTTASDVPSTFSGNLMMANLHERKLDYEQETGVVDTNGDAIDDSGRASDTYTRFILAKHYATWKKSDNELIKPRAFETKEAAVFYRMHIFDSNDPLVSSDPASPQYPTTLNTLGANKAYLLLATNSLPDALWKSSGSGSREYVAILGVSDSSEYSEDSVNSKSPSATYNLKGQAVNDEGKLRPGLYIRNGRKVVVRN